MTKKKIIKTLIFDVMVCHPYLHDGRSKLRDGVDVETWGWGVMRSTGGLGQPWSQAGGGGAGDWLVLSHRLSREGLQGADTSFTCEHREKLFRFQ